MKAGRVVFTAGVAPERAAPIAALEGARVVSFDAAEGLTSSEPPAELALIVLGGGIDTIRAVRAGFASIPILALLEDAGSAFDAAHAGADYALSFDAPAALLAGVYVSACRDADRRRDGAVLVRTNAQLAEAQRQFLHSSSLAALGQMAAGVAHEINNPLQYLLAGIDEISSTEGAMSGYRQTLEDMREGAERIRAVTRSLLPFARSDAAQFERLDLNEIVEWAARLTANEIRHRAQLVLELAPTAPMIGQSTRLGQLVTNLLANAAHAITEGDCEHHRIVVRTEVRDKQVCLSVEDTGRGIPEDILPRIFDPFFTTKEREEGNGLGLALCAEVAKRHRGSITVESTVGVGTRFFVVFGENVERPRTPVPPSSAPTLLGRTPRVLIIDDEEPLVRAYKRFLRHLDVVVAVGGKAALDVLARDSDFDVVLCDLMMPNVDGPMVHAHIESTFPQLVERIVFCSGGAFTPRVRAFLESVPNEVLDKPIGVQQLRQVLDKRIANR